MDISPIIISIPDHSVHNTWCLLLTLVGPEFFGAKNEKIELSLDSRAPWKDLAPVIWEWDLTKALNLGKLPSADNPGGVIFRRLAKCKQSSTFDTRHGNWCKCSSEHEMIKMFLKLSYPIKAFDRRIHKFLFWFRHQRYMAPALWEEISWCMRILLHHNALCQIDTKNYPVHMAFPVPSPAITQPAHSNYHDDDDDEDDDDDDEDDDDDDGEEEDAVVETLFDTVERFSKYLFFLIQGSEGSMTNEEISQICKRETGLYPRQHMTHLSIHESLTGFICKHLSDRVVTITDEKVYTHSLRPIPPPPPPTATQTHSSHNLPPPPPANALKFEVSTSSSSSTTQPPEIPTPNTTNIPRLSSTSSEFDFLPIVQTLKFSTREEYAEYIYSIIEKSHPLRNDVISAICRTETGVYPRHHFRGLEYDGFLTKFIRTYLWKKVVSKKSESGDWIHDLISSDSSKNTSDTVTDSIEKYVSEDYNEPDRDEVETKVHSISPVNEKTVVTTKSNPSPELNTGQDLQNFKNYLYNVVRSFAGPITSAEINAQCQHDLDATSSTLLVKLGYNDKFMIFIRTFLVGYVLCYHRDGQAYYVATPKIFPGYTPMKLIKTYPLTTLSLFAEFIYSQVVALGGLNAPVSHHALDTRCVEVIGTNLQQKLHSLEWRSTPVKFLSTYPSGRLIVIIIDGVTCLRVKSSLQTPLPAGARVVESGSSSHQSSENHPTGRVVTIK